MIQEILDFLSSTWDDVKAAHILYDYEVGVIYRLGKLHREMSPGLNWKIPVIEKAKTVSKQDDIKTLPTQTVGDWVVTPIVCFYVKNVVKYHNHVLGENDTVVDDIAAAVITEHLKDNLFDKESMLREIRERCTHYGLRVRDLNFSTAAAIPSIRLILDRPEITE